MSVAPSALTQSACGKLSQIYVCGFTISASPFVWIVCVSTRFKILGPVSKKENLNVG